MVYKKTEKTGKFFCEKCCFASNDKNDFNRHLQTAKHKKGSDIPFTVSSEKHKCSFCEKIYNHSSGLYRHKKKCSITNDNNICETVSIVSDTPILSKQEAILLCSHQDLINEIKELKSIVEELKSNGITNNQTINNTQNNQFNLQLYLNETCSNAINIDTLLKNIKVTIENVIEIGEIGYSKGIGNLIAKHIKGMNQIEKPIQTTDVKRGLSWIKNKNNEWIKDEDLTLANNFIFLVGDKYFREYADGITTINEWKDTQSKIHDKVVESISQITKVIISDDKSKDYSKIHKTIAESTMVKK